MISIAAATVPVGEITLYAASDRAQCTRIAPLRLPVQLSRSQTTVQIEGLPDGFERDSLRVEGQGAASQGVTILDVVARTLLPSEAANEKSDAQIKLEEVERQLDAERKQLEVLHTIDNTLSRFQQTASPKDPGSNLASFLDLYAKRTMQGHADQTAVQQRIDELERLRRELMASKPAGSGAVRVTLEVAGGEEGAVKEIGLKLTYFVYGASWRPSYDLRASAATSQDDSPLTIRYNAVITNNTGEDWRAATLQLSTVSPNLSTAIPTLRTPELGFREALPPPPPPPAPAPRGMGGMAGGAIHGSRSLMMAAAPMVMRKAAVVELDEEKDAFGGREVSVEGGAGRVGIVMRIEGKVDIESDGEEHRVLIASVDTVAKLTHIAVPTDSTSAFIRAEAKNTSLYPLIAGPTNIYVASSFSGKGHLSEVGPGEDFKVSLGVDPGVRVTCPKEVRFKKTQGGFVRKETEIVSFVQKMTVENTHTTPLRLLVQYAFPRSTDAKVIVRPSLPKGAAWEDEREPEGKAKWEGVLQARQKGAWSWEWDVEGTGWVVL